VLQRPAPLERAFERIRANGAAAADVESSERALLEALRPVMVSVWPEVAWRFGLLTATALGLASRPITEPLEIPETRIAVRAEISELNEFPQMLLRVGWAL